MLCRLNGQKKKEREKSCRWRRKKIKRCREPFLRQQLSDCWKADGCNTHMTWTEAPAWRELHRIIKGFFFSLLLHRKPPPPSSLPPPLSHDAPVAWRCRFRRFQPAVDTSPSLILFHSTLIISAALIIFSPVFLLPTSSLTKGDGTNILF